MGIRDSLSRLKERLDPKSTRKGRKPDDTESVTDGEGFDPAGSLPRPDEPRSASNKREGGRGEVIQRRSHLYTDVEVVAGTGSGRVAGDQFYSRPSTPLFTDGSPAVPATVKLLRGVRDSANSFGPLRSIARTLCFILETCEVCPPSHMCLIHSAYRHFSKQRWIYEP